MEVQIDVNEIIDELTAQVANLAKENAILKAQIRAMTNQNDQLNKVAETAKKVVEHHENAKK